MKPRQYERTMRIVSWNVGHQTRVAPIHPRLLDAVRALAPDVLLLNEYVHDAEVRAGFIQELAAVGLTHSLFSEQKMRAATTTGGKEKRNNQVLAADRFPLHRGDLRGPEVHDNGGETNFLHVLIPPLSIELVGIRVPAYDPATLTSYWDSFLQLAASAAGRKICFIGDFNADPDGTKHRESRRFAGLRGHGWEIPAPDGDWSFKSGTRIDHALASPTFPLISARYVAVHDDLILAGSTDAAISDHAALVVECAQ